MMCGFGNNLVGPEQYLVTLTPACFKVKDAMRCEVCRRVTLCTVLVTSTLKKEKYDLILHTTHTHTHTLCIYTCLPVRYAQRLLQF